jgi:N utilization substance protein A
MNTEELLRMVDAIHRDRNIDKEIVFQALEDAFVAAVRKKLGAGEDLVVEIDRKTGEYTIEDDEGEYEFDPAILGRIAAQTFKQSLIQRIREAERDVLYDEYEARVGELINGTVQRFESDALVVNLGKTEAYLPREERTRGETFSPGDRIRAIVIEVRKDGPRVRIIVSRTHPDLVRRLFELEVPEIADEIIEIKRVVREPGYRTKMAVLSTDPKIDPIGACVGVRGARIKAVIDELRGERIDIIKWSDSLETLIMNGLKPAVINIDNIYPDIDAHSATVLVDDDQQSLAIGKRGQNVRLASRLCGWDIEIKTPAEYEADQLGGGAPADDSDYSDATDYDGGGDDLDLPVDDSELPSGDDIQAALAAEQAEGSALGSHSSTGEPGAGVDDAGGSNPKPESQG